MNLVLERMNELMNMVKSLSRFFLPRRCENPKDKHQKDYHCGGMRAWTYAVLWKTGVIECTLTHLFLLNIIAAGYWSENRGPAAWLGFDGGRGGGGGSSAVCLMLRFHIQRGAGQRLAPGRRHPPGAGHLHGSGRAGQAVRLQNPQLLEPDQVSRVSTTTATTARTPLRAQATAECLIWVNLLHLGWVWGQLPTCSGSLLRAHGCSSAGYRYDLG